MNQGGRAQRQFGIVCILAYLALSWALLFDMRLGKQTASLVYPLDTFSMYGPLPIGDASHLLIRDRDGVVHHVSEFRAFDCTEPVVGGTSACANVRGIAYVHEELSHYIEQHRGSGDTDVQLIARSWKLRVGSAPQQISDCVIAHCRVSR